MHGFSNLVLRINLTRQSYEIQLVSDSMLRRSLGGKGLAAQLLLQHNPPGVEPLAPENHLIFAVGPLAGTGLAGGSPYGIFAKSPENGLLGEIYVDGGLAEQISATGFDAVVFHGETVEPVWLEIDEHAVLFHPAGEFWGASTHQTVAAIRRLIRRGQPKATECGILAFEPAGEGASLVAAGLDGRVAARQDPFAGGVLAAKKVKAIVFRGNKQKSVADPWRVAGLALEDEVNTAGADSATLGRPEEADGERIPLSVPDFCDREDWQTLCQTLILNPARHRVRRWDQLGKVLAAVVGICLAEDELRRIAANVLDDVRRFNLRELPAGNGALAPPWPGGQPPGRSGGEETAGTRAWLAEYYRRRGWDDRGHPPDSDEGATAAGKRHQKGQDIPKYPGRIHESFG